MASIISSIVGSLDALLIKSLLECACNGLLQKDAVFKESNRGGNSVVKFSSKGDQILTYDLLLKSMWNATGIQLVLLVPDITRIDVITTTDFLEGE